MRLVTLLVEKKKLILVVNSVCKLLNSDFDPIETDFKDSWRVFKAKFISFCLVLLILTVSITVSASDLSLFEILFSFGSSFLSSLVYNRSSVFKAAPLLIQSWATFSSGSWSGICFRSLYVISLKLWSIIAIICKSSSVTLVNTSVADSIFQIWLQNISYPTCPSSVWLCHSHIKRIKRDKV